MHYRDLQVPVSVGVGATIDFLAGQVSRAPVWMQRSGAEWIYRLAQEPRRLFARYATDLRLFGSSILGQWWQMQFHAPPSSERDHAISVDADGKWQKISLPVRFDLAAIADGQAGLQSAAADHRHCLLDMSNVQFIDSTAMGLIIRLQKQLTAAGRHLVLLSPTLAAIRAFELMHLRDFFSIAPSVTAAEKLIAALDGEQSHQVQAQEMPGTRMINWHGEITAANTEAVWKTTAAFISEPR